MITLDQYVILNSCADSPELFYFPFAAVNYGGQVFPRSAGPNCRQYVDDRSWEISRSGAVVAQDLLTLIGQDLMHCLRVAEDESAVEVIPRPTFEDFTAYLGYSCLTWDEHVAEHGYGPHEFEITEIGLREIEKDEYRMYDAALGWSDG